jgi:hypothetical protein
MPEDRTGVVRRSTAAFVAGTPEWDLHTEDFQLLNIPEPAWQPSPGPTAFRSLS